MSAAWGGLHRLLHVATRRGVARDVDDELQFHVESRVGDLVARGHDPVDARAVAEREFGDLDESRRELIDADQRRYERVERGTTWEAWWHDVRFSARSLRRTPGVAAAVVVLLGLGIGANAATFSLADDLFVRPPAGVSAPDGLTRLYVHSDHTKGRYGAIQPTFVFPAYVAMARALGSQAAFAAYTEADSEAVGIRRATETLRVVYATSSYFPVLGALPALGRTFTGDEDSMGAGVPVAVIGDALWHARYGGDSAVLGQQIDVALARYTIIGVAAPGFIGPDLDRTDIWLPMAMRPGAPGIGDTPWYRDWGGASWVRVIGRLHRGTTAASLAAAATPVLRLGERDNVMYGPDTTATVLAGPWQESLGPSVTTPVERAITTRLVGVTLMVLVIACANVVNLLLLRGVRRRREIAIRLSLGISRARLVRQLLIESTMLAVIGGVASLGAAVWGASLLRATILPSVHWGAHPMRWQVIVASLGAAVVTGVVAGMAPALHAGRTDLTASLKSGTSEGGSPRSPLRAGLIVVQAALCMVLLAGAGLFVRSLRAVQSIDLGYDASRVAYGWVYFRNPTNRTVEFSNPARSQELTQGLASVALRLRSEPGVESIALASSPPMNGYAMTSPRFGDGAPAPKLNGLDAGLIAAEPSFFATTGATLVRGRLFTAAEQADSDQVVVVNETMARTYWPHSDALGQCFFVSARDRTCTTVIGIARDARLKNIIESPRVEMFTPIRRGAGMLSRPAFIIVRAAPGRASQVTDRLRRALVQQFPGAEPPYVTSMARAAEPELRPWRVGAELFALFGGLALVVAIFGVYSTLAYTVGHRLQEIGIRVALGARRGQIARLVLAHGMRPLVVGVACGLIITVLLGRFVASMLYETSATNPLVLGGAAVVLLLAGLLGSLAPAWRATRVDPAVSLRAE